MSLKWMKPSCTMHHQHVCVCSLSLVLKPHFVCEPKGAQRHLHMTLSAELMNNRVHLYLFTVYIFWDWCLQVLQEITVSEDITVSLISSKKALNPLETSQVSEVAIQLRLHYSQSLKPCKLQKPIPNHQSSFCWICLLLLTLSIIRSSCPPSHHWISLGFHFAGLNPISLISLSRWPGEGRYPKHINWSPGFPRARFLDPSSSPHTLHHWVPSYRHMVSPTISMLMTHSSISHFDQMIQR